MKQEKKPGHPAVDRPEDGGRGKGKNPPCPRCGGKSDRIRGQYTFFQFPALCGRQSGDRPIRQSQSGDRIHFFSFRLYAVARTGTV